MTVLAEILRSTREDVAARRARVREDGLAREAAERRSGRGQQRGDAMGDAGGAGRPFTDALRRPGVAVIAEHKRRSPSAGVLRAGSGVSEVVGAYERAGAAALSILTEERHFDGSLADLREARRASSLPILRKDFIVDDYQLLEAAAAGADAVLLIVAALTGPDLRALAAAAVELGLEVLVEVHDADELDAALALEEAVIGINNRDLRDFSVDVQRTFALLDRVPDHRVVVSESGLHSRAQLDQLERVGVAAVLVGERLMRASDPEAACRELTGRGRG